jgi:hypothetical protein
MYSKQEATQLKKEFWTAFGQYMTPTMSAEGEKIAWVNYKTGEKNIAFRLEADNKKATVTIELSHPDTGIQQLYFEQFRHLGNIFETMVEGDWTWDLHITDEYGKTISVIQTALSGVSVFKKEDWPKLISFFKTNMIALDEFWSNVKYSFEMLR